MGRVSLISGISNVFGWLKIIMSKPLMWSIIVRSGYEYLKYSHGEN